MQAPPSPPSGHRHDVVCAALVVVAAAALFGLLAAHIDPGTRLSALDAEWAQSLHRWAVPGLTRWIVVVTDLHSTFAVSCYAVLAGLVLAARRQWRRLGLLFACIAGGLTLNVLLKLAFHRARPVLDQPLSTLSTYSFPSGHVVGSTILYGLVVALVFTGSRKAHWRALAALGALLAVMLVAFTRMYLGAHYFSDVLAAFAEGIGWLAICFGGFAVMTRTRAGTPPLSSPPADRARRVRAS